MKTACALMLSALLCGSSLAAGADAKDAATPAAPSDAVSNGEPQAQVRLVSEFSGFAGSDANARNLVMGLRQSSEITLTAPGAGGPSGAATRFVPPIRHMDYGNVRIALALAREQLAQLGITRPTPAQIKAVLAGGGIASHANGRVATPFLHPGLLQMRAGGMGWAKIAGTMGITLAQAMNGKARQAGVPAPPDSRLPAAPGTTGGIISVARVGADVSAPRRTGTAPGPISAASITTSTAGAPRTMTVAKPVAPERRPPKPQPGPEARPSGGSVLAAADGAARTDSGATSVREKAQGEAARTLAAAAPAAADESGGSEDGPAAE